AYFQALEQRRARYSVGTLLALTAGIPFRMTQDYDCGEAIYWDITGQRLRERGIAAPTLTPKEAGRRLVRIGEQYHLTLFECYLPDYAGHGQSMAQALQVVTLIDAFIESVVTYLPPQATLIVSSDHGNIEDLSSKHHTLNPVPLLVFGPQAAAFSSVTDITGITPKIVELLGKHTTREATSRGQDLQA
ncbi:MAG TPA: alkaline phosphatase family protein, partial [Candidatus Caenarcaniphilales bacterium]